MCGKGVGILGVDLMYMRKCELSWLDFGQGKKRPKFGQSGNHLECVAVPAASAIIYQCLK